MRVLVNGIIAGIDDEKYIRSVLKYGAGEGLDIEYFNLVKEMESTGNKKLSMLLGTTNYLFEVIREREYRKIGYRLQEKNIKNAIIRVPATIEWNRINIKLKDQKEIKEYIRPDVVVTLIDAEWLIRKKFEDPAPGNDFLRRIKEQKHTIRDILNWMNEEVSLADDWARFMGIRHYVVPVGQDPYSLYKLVKYKDIPSFYVSYSMTHAETEKRKEINEVIKRLYDYGLVIDPQAIEIGFNYETVEDKEATYAFTVHRDLHWFVGKVDAIVAIHPYTEKPPLSTGMMDELGHARDYLKKRYMIFPPEHQSPFTTDSYIEKGHLFRTADEFFKCLEEEGFRKLE
ncbi:MAG TPA: hypothetical protein DCZ94_13185 [Lentisphaeria bacterium]|nr:MAG: hypothetical protein A2X48_15295 [Lentisphaerae bacterium GWF2_49_21]HBC87902.1 hypothetical protein [Lentisphaeria bacterium]